HIAPVQTPERGMALHWDLSGDRPRNLLAIGVHAPATATTLTLELHGELADNPGAPGQPAAPGSAPKAPRAPRAPGPPEAGDDLGLSDDTAAPAPVQAPPGGPPDPRTPGGPGAPRQRPPGEVLIGLRDANGVTFGQRVQLSGAWQRLTLKLSELHPGPKAGTA